MEVRTEEVIYVLGLPFDYVFGFAVGLIAFPGIRWLKRHPA